MTAAEVGPTPLGPPNLGVRDLPQQEVAHAHLAARADQQVGIGLSGRVEKIAEPPFVEILRPDAGGNRPSRSVDDFGAPSVIERDIEKHAAVDGCFPDADFELVLDVERELFVTADHLESDVVLEKCTE